MDNGIEQLLETTITHPQSRIEEYLFNLLNGETNAPEPRSRIETYLHQLCEMGLSGGGGSGATAAQIEQIETNKNNIDKLSEEKVSNPSTGEVGQILEIETVDEKGKPKTYKAVNKPTGGEVSDEQIAEAVENYLNENPIEGGGGADGIGIQSVEQTTTSTEDGGTNIITVTKTDGTSSTFQVLNGSKGSQGEKGASGYTPVKGTDYFTEEDKTEIVNDVVAEANIDVVPDYVKTEAASVLSRVINAQGNRTFNIAFITDLHNNGGESDVQIRHACQGIGYIADRIKLDAFVCLGDHTDGMGSSNWSECLNDIKDCNSYKHKLVKNTDILEVIGNHDFNASYKNVTHKCTTAYNSDVVWGSKPDGYFYKDYDDYKLRIIGVNTSENNTIGVLNTQYKWFIETLDLSSKEDASEWQILIISHIPLDWPPFTVFSYVLDAYVKGASWADETYSCDYTGKNQSKIIGCVHGHIHNLLVDRLYLGNSSSSTEQTNVWRIAIPEVTELYGNHYYAPWKHDTTYSKVANTKDDTSFNVLCIDLDNHTIKAVCYGAGVDRTINYTVFDENEEDGGDDNTGTTTYTNQLPISTDTDGNIYNGTGYKVGYRFNSSGGESAIDGYALTGFIPAKANDVVRMSKGLWTSNGVQASYQMIKLYDESKTALTTGYISYQDIRVNGGLADFSEGDITQFTIASGTGTTSAITAVIPNTAYIRLAVAESGLGGGVITINEEIV